MKTFTSSFFTELIKTHVVVGYVTVGCAKGEQCFRIYFRSAKAYTEALVGGETRPQAPGADGGGAAVLEARYGGLLFIITVSYRSCDLVRFCRWRSSSADEMSRIRSQLYFALVSARSRSRSSLYPA